MFKIFPKENFTIISDYSFEETFTRLKLEVNECNLYHNTDLDLGDTKFFYGELNKPSFKIAPQRPLNILRITKYGYLPIFLGTIYEDEKVKIYITAKNYKRHLLPNIITFSFFTAIFLFVNIVTLLNSEFDLACFICLLCFSFILLGDIFFNNLYFSRKVKEAKQKFTQMFTAKK